MVTYEQGGNEFFTWILSGTIPFVANDTLGTMEIDCSVVSPYLHGSGKRGGSSVRHRN